MENKFRIIAKTLFGLEELLANELEALGAKNIEVLNRAVAFEGDTKLLFRCNYECRLTLRILKPIQSFEAENQDELYENMFKIDWTEYMDVNQTFAIDSTENDSNFTNTMFISLKAKDAIADQFRNKFNERPSVDTENPHLRLNIHIFRNQCTVSIDTSGYSLHKRGYRMGMNKAPISEVLSAGIIALSGWDKKQTFIDPMCGSGTNLIEAAMLAKNIPAGYFRDGYGFMKWKNFDKELWAQIVDDANSKIIDLPCKIIGIDNDKRSFDIATENIAEAGLTDDIVLEKNNFQDYNHEFSEGVVVMNPPYGERLNEEDIEQLYEEIGDTLKKKYKGFKAWIITSNLYAAKRVGLKTSRKIPLYNGGTECRLLCYELYDGSRKHRRAE